MPAEAQHFVTRHPLLLWTGWVVGPVAWSLHLMVSYLLVEWVCLTGNAWALHAVTLVTALVSAAGAAVAWRQWSVVGRRWPRAGIHRVERTRFLAVGGLVMSVLSTLVILAEGIPNFILWPCL